MNKKTASALQQIVKTAGLLFILLVLLTLSPVVFAQEETTLPTISPPPATPTPAPAAPKPAFSTMTAIPPHINLNINPGETAQETLQVKNDSDQELTLKAAITDFIVTDKEGTPLLVTEDVNNRWALAQWITLSPSSFVIRPNEIQVLSMTIATPADALPGGHYAMVTYEPSEEGMLGATGAKITQKVGTLVNVVIAGPITEDAQVVRFQPSARFAEYGPIDFTTEIKNLSDTHISPSGSIKITNIFNQTSALLPLEKVNIFPLASRIYHNSFAGKWRLGRYQAELKAGYGTTGQVLTAAIYFWIVPWKVLLAFTAALAALTLLYVYLKKQSKKKADKVVEKRVKEALEEKEAGNKDM